ncbi:hypothetical protein [Bradyrhizobium symbiodeficiens]|uniref:hypothetical protein n=1 Tax=Bradyrhizobium symbiodeficiens TaxID=1404367 RepID=UPI0026CDDDA8
MHERAAIRVAIFVVTFLSFAGPMGSAIAAPLAPATTAMTTSTGLNVTQVRWRHGDGGGALAAGLLTGMMIGGLFAAPGYYGPYPYYPYAYGGYYPPRYVAPIGYGAPGWEAYCTFSFVRSDQRDIFGARRSTALLQIARRLQAHST